MHHLLPLNQLNHTPNKHFNYTLSNLSIKPKPPPKSSTPQESNLISSFNYYVLYYFEAMKSFCLMIILLITTVAALQEEADHVQDIGESRAIPANVIARSGGIRKVVEGVHNGKEKKRMGSVEKSWINEERMNASDDQGKVLESCMSQEHHNCEKKRAACIKSCIHEHGGLQKENVAAAKCSFRCKKCAPADC